MPWMSNYIDVRTELSSNIPRLYTDVIIYPYPEFKSCLADILSSFLLICFIVFLIFLLSHLRSHSELSVPPYPPHDFHYNATPWMSDERPPPSQPSIVPGSVTWNAMGCHRKQQMGVRQGPVPRGRYITNRGKRICHYYVVEFQKKVP